MTAQRRLLILMVLALTLALAGGVGWSRLVLEPRLTALAAAEEQALQDRSWRRLVAERDRLLTLAAEDLADRPGLAQAVARGDAAAVGAIGRAALPDLARRYDVAGLEIVGRDGRPLYASWPGGTEDGAALRRADGPIPALPSAASHGFVQHRHGILLSRDVPLATDGGGRLRLYADPAALVDALAAPGVPGANDTLAALTDLRHQIVAAAGPEGWHGLAIAASADGEALEAAGADGRLGLGLVVPLADIAGRPLGQIVTVRAVPEAATRDRLFHTLLLSAGAALLLLSLLMARGLSGEFGPLRRLIASLEALGGGRTDVTVDGSGGPDEAGRLAQAARALRERSLMLATLRLSRDRQHKREQRFLRQQLTSLAQALEGETRAAVLRDLDRLDTAAPPPNAIAPLAPLAQTGDSGDFALLAGAFENLTHRLRDQHGRLTALVAELNEALRTKSEFQLLQKELDVARTLQLSILPADLPDHRGIAAHGVMMPAREVGGDFYDVFPLPDEKLALVVADVSGKGVPAAFFSLIGRTLLKATALSGLAPAACIDKVNALLCAENEQAMFITLFFAVLDPESGRLDYVNAGHNRPLVLRADGTVDEVAGTGDMALGVFDDNAYRAAAIDLAAGDLLLLYTDGVTEAFADDGAEFGESRLRAVLAAATRTPSWLVPKEISNAVRAFEGDSGPADDLTCLAVGYRRGA